ncbi:SafA/ExsA family spore coat assembly protein [Halobacillus salinarum]|uniref:SafA/ExsA family spore coat assembly protein n=1 Tax=Halobacillus salinarum TaxID=2932257 RepID=A0ABY4ERD0_9BACI|nr:SafA/ExsA family spore coat assembly protein [Halobacillus salinarum]UOQ46262.1 SafA/ExsA family spore coat assembly protein [Halobacillus salinarum]
MRIHIVQKGDTLWNIAKKYGVNFEELKAVNTQLSNPDMIMPGMKIKVPQGTKQVKKEAPKKMPTQHPYKDTSPKPIPVIKEDEKVKEKPMQPVKEKPMQPVKEKPMQPMQPMQPIMPQFNIPVQMPMMEQQLQNYYTTFNLPPMPKAPEPKAKEAKKEKKEEPKKEAPVEAANTAPQEYYQPMQYYPPAQPQLVHSDFYCCPPYPVMMPAHMPMHPQGQMPWQGEDWESPSSAYMHAQMPPNCGCGDDGQQNPGMMGYGPQFYPGMHGAMPQGQQGPMAGGYGQQWPMGGYGQQAPMGNWNMPQSMGNWNQQQPPMGNWNPQQPWRGDDVDED